MQSNRKRKQVTYVEDGHEADDNDVPMHQFDENGPSEAAAEGDMAGQDTQSNLVHQDMAELNNDQMHTDPGTAEDMNEDPSGSELCQDHQTDSAPKDYLFTGGGFCMEEGDEQDTAGDQSGAEMEDGTSDACEDTGGVSDSGKSMSLSTTGFAENVWKTEAHLHRRDVMPAVVSVPSLHLQSVG